MVPRTVAPHVESALNRQAAVALIGPRQVGKTTLALEIGRSRDALYLDLEDRGARWAIEIKRSLSARVGRGFHLACADVEPTRAFIVHAGGDRYPLAENLEAVGVRELAGELRARS